MLDEIAKKWVVAKQEEAAAIDHRRNLEDMMISALKLAEDFTGTQTHDTATLVVKVSGRINQNIDGDKLQEIAMEHGLSDHLANLFRWKPEINAKAWKACDDSITRPLLLAVTTKPGRPTFSIQLKETKE
jgi:hypothetical protein